MVSSICAECKGAFNPSRKDQKFCSLACARECIRKAWQAANPKTSLVTLKNNTVAEINEMRVAIDLLGRGFEVYRAAVAGMPCDMLACGKNTWLYPGNEPRRIEVTTGNRTPSGALQHPRRDDSQYDILAIVVGEDIFYQPELDY